MDEIGKQMGYLKAKRDSDPVAQRCKESVVKETEDKYQDRKLPEEVRFELDEWLLREGKNIPSRLQDWGHEGFSLSTEQTRLLGSQCVS